MQSKTKEPHELISLEEAVDRVKALESLLQKFAQIGIVMSNAKFNLCGADRPDEPSGGYWINGVRNAMMKPADELFFAAIVIYGRERAESEFCQAMEDAQRTREAAAEAKNEKIH